MPATPAAACAGTLTLDVKLLLDAPAPRIARDFSRKQLADLAKANGSAIQEPLGFYAVVISYPTEVQVEQSATHACARLITVRLNARLDPRTVEIANDLEGSCLVRTVLEHYARIAAADQDAVATRSAELLQQLRTDLPALLDQKQDTPDAELRNLTFEAIKAIVEAEAPVTEQAQRQAQAAAQNGETSEKLLRKCDTRT